MQKKENDKKLQEPAGKESEVQRKETTDDNRKNQAQTEKTQKKETTVESSKRKRFGALIGACAGAAVLVICLIAANSRLAQTVIDTPETTVQATQAPDEKTSVTASGESEKTETKSTSGTISHPDKQAAKNSAEDNASADKKESDTADKEQEKTQVSENIENTGTEVVTKEPADTTAAPGQAESTVVQSQPETMQSQTDTSQAAAPAETIPQETTVEITPEPTPLPHVHSWETKFRTVHHDAVTEEVKVIDQAAYTEPIYEEKPVYETYSVYVCDICGEDIEDIGVHSESHIDWETLTNPFHYHVDFRQGAQIGTEMVQTGSRTYPEKSHMETKEISAAYDEQVPDGYVCTGCGALK